MFFSSLALHHWTNIQSHKRLRAYAREDFDQLVSLLSGASRIVVTPNTLTETLNIAGQIAEPARIHIFEAFRRLLGVTEEVYVASRRASDQLILRLGLKNFVVLESTGKKLTIITADLDLYLEALRQGQSVINFNHLREADL